MCRNTSNATYVVVPDLQKEKEVIKTVELLTQDLVSIGVLCTKDIPEFFNEELRGDERE